MYSRFLTTISVPFYFCFCFFLFHFNFFFSSRSLGTNINLSLTETRLPALEKRVEQASPLDDRMLGIREEWEQFGREMERKEREIREQRARKKREREAREQEEASRWPQQQEAITGPWCVCANEGQEVSLVSSREDQHKYFDLPLADVN